MQVKFITCHGCGFKKRLVFASSCQLSEAIYNSPWFAVGNHLFCPTCYDKRLTPQPGNKP